MHVTTGTCRATWKMTSSVEPDPDHPSDPNSDSIYLTCKSGRYTDASIRLTEDDEFVCVVSIGAKFLYVIPGFDVLGVELRHIQVKGFSKIGKPEDVFDMFIKNDLSLSRSYPSHMVLRDVKVPVAQYNHLYTIIFCYTIRGAPILPKSVPMLCYIKLNIEYNVYEVILRRRKSSNR